MIAPLLAPLTEILILPPPSFFNLTTSWRETWASARVPETPSFSSAIVSNLTPSRVEVLTGSEKAPLALATIVLVEVGFR